MGLKLNKTIDKENQKIVNDETKKWRNVLHRLLDITLFLAQQNLAFRGHREDVSSENRCIFLELVQLIAKYDPVLKDHCLKLEEFTGGSKRVPSYLSKGIQNEFIFSLGEHVREKIIADIKKAKYYGIFFDSTPDESRTDQMSQIIRYVHVEDDVVEVRESFLGFFMSGKTAENMTKDVLQQLEKDDLDIARCRALGYDNAASMSGVHGGVQRRILDVNPKALFSPCANHSLNLCGVHAFSCVPSSVTCFGTIEKLYSFFSSSTHRWELLVEKTGKRLKRSSDTRWSAHCDSVKVVKENVETIVSTLEDMQDPSKANLDTRSAASLLLPAICDFTFLTYVTFWHTILEEVNLVQQYLQSPKITLDKGLTKLKTLNEFLVTERTTIIDNSVTFGTNKCNEMDINIDRRGRRRVKKTMPGELAYDAGLSIQEEVRRSMFECIDRFIQELSRRYMAMEEISNIFQIAETTFLLKASDDALDIALEKLVKIYDEFDKEQVLQEIKRLRSILLVVAVNVKFIFSKDGNVNTNVEKNNTGTQSNFNCTLTKLFHDLFKYSSPTNNSNIKSNFLEDSEKAKDFLSSINNFNTSNALVAENASVDQSTVDGIIASINMIKSNFTMNSNNETDATRINETVIVEDSTKNGVEPFDGQFATTLASNYLEKEKSDFTLSKAETDLNKNKTLTINTTEDSSIAPTYIEVLTIEPNNTDSNQQPSSEHIVDMLKYLMPSLKDAKSNITIIENKVYGNKTIPSSGSVSTVIVTFCNENLTKVNSTHSDANKTIHTDEIHKQNNLTEYVEYYDDYNTNMATPHIDDPSYDELMPEEINLTALEQRNVLEAADYGMQMMHELYSIKEPKLYSMGLWLDDTNPARYVAAFNAPSEDSAKYFRYGYASLQAAAKLQQLHSSEEALQGRTEETLFPGVGALRNSALLEQCPLKGAPKCPPASKRYRTHDGTCNNAVRPRWGSTMTPAQRFLPPHYSDGLQAARRSVAGAPLPSPREISAMVHEDHNVETATITHMLMQWGQLVDHDLTSTSQSRGFNGSVPRCCRDGGRDFVPRELLHPECMPISVPSTDRFYGPLGVRCLEFVRSSPAPRDDCSLGWREQLNQVSAYLDASPLYGSSARASDKLRLFRNGMLQYGRVQQRRPLLPPERSRKDELCRAGAVSADCFRSGDNRVNEHPGLVAAHIVWLRQHNRMATELSHLNPHWSDEKIYQETRRIVGAMMQHITYNEFLPIVLGSEVMRLFDLQPQRKGFYRGYSPKVNAGPASAFGSAAFRFGHSLVQGSMMRYDRHHRPINNNVSLHDEPTNPSNIWSAGAVDRLLLGMVNQPIQKRDEFITKELTNHLFQTPQFDFGMDLAAINVQRGRDHGIPEYTAWREPCGLTEIRDFEDLFRVMPSRAVRKLQDLYRDVDDIDLFTGGMAERPVVGGLVGPTFACIIAQQFSNLRKGDRFWYENGGFDSSFTPAQLQQIRRIALAQVLCKTLDTIDNIQPFAFLTADQNENRRISCANGILNNFDLSPWVEIDSTQDNNVEFDKTERITKKPDNIHKMTKQPITDSKPAHAIDASGLNKVIQTKPVSFVSMTNTTKAHNSITKKKSTPRPPTKPNKTDKPDRQHSDIIMTKTNKTVQNIDDKLDFRNKSRRYDNLQSDDGNSHRPHKQQYNYDQNNDYDDNKNENDESNIYHQSVVINNHRNQRPNKYNRPVIAVTENIDKFTYLINYVPKTSTRPWRQTTRRPNYDRDVVKVTYQTYDDTYRRPQPQYVNNHETLPTYFNNRLVQKPIDKYDDYRRRGPESLTTRYIDDIQSSARSSDFNPFFTKATETISQKATTKDEVTFPTTTEQFYRLVTFSYLGTYNKMTDIDKNNINVNADVKDKEPTHPFHANEPNKILESNVYSKDFTLTNNKAYKQDTIATDQFTTSGPPRLSTFFSNDKLLRPNTVNRPTLKTDTKRDDIISTITDKVDILKTPGRYYYASNVLHRYPDMDSSMSKTNIKTDTNAQIIKENYNNPGRPNDFKQTIDMQERSSVDSLTFFEDADVNTPERTLEKGGKLRVVKPNVVHNTHSVAFQVIPSENSPTTWAVYEEKSEPQDTLHAMPAISSDPHSLLELPRPMNLSSAAKLKRRRPAQA